ncbi:MAG: DUF6057 family protein [Salinivirgaceae bacterium]|nr:DUF6057 family protein [Salinivirgaceae bacterium]
MQKKITLFGIAVVYLTLFAYVFFKIDPSLFDYYQNPSFVLDAQYFADVVKVPGGMAYYMSQFVEQYFVYKFQGAVLMVLMALVVGWLSVLSVRKVASNRLLIELFAFVLPAVFSAVAWIDLLYAFSIHISLIFGLLAFLAFANAPEKWRQLVFVALVLLVYHISGPLFLYMFGLMSLISVCKMVADRKTIIKHQIIILLVTVMYPIVCYSFLLPLTPKQAFLNIFPESPLFKSCTIKAEHVALLSYVPVLLIFASIGVNKFSQRLRIIIASLAMVAVFGVSFGYAAHVENPVLRVSVQVRKASYYEDWNRVIDLALNNRHSCKVYERYINQCYNLALAKTGQMGSMLFNYPQMLGIDGMFIESPMVGEICMPSSYLYKQIGFVEPALRFAYEAETNLPYSKYVLRQIVDLLIIKGDYQQAEMYLKRLDKVMLCKRFVADRRSFISGGKSKLNRDYVEQMREMQPTDVFYTNNQLTSIFNFVRKNPGNKPAYDYLLATCLLSSSVNDDSQLATFAQLLAHSPGFNASNLPKVWQEGIVAYFASCANSKTEPVELAKSIKISGALQNEFQAFSQLRAQNPKYAVTRFLHSYWTYYAFQHPSITKNSVSIK